MPVPAGTCAISSENDSSPPAEAPMPTIGKDIAFFAPFVAYHAVDREALTFFRDRSVASTQTCLRAHLACAAAWSCRLSDTFTWTPAHLSTNWRRCSNHDSPPIGEHKKRCTP